MSGICITALTQVQIKKETIVHVANYTLTTDTKYDAGTVTLS